MPRGEINTAQDSPRPPGPGMSFPENQLGRLGGYYRQLFDAGGVHSPDRLAALAVCSDLPTALGTRPSLAEALVQRGLLPPVDPQWVQWSKEFSRLTAASGLTPLTKFSCPTPVARVPEGVCPHSLTPPTQFGALSSGMLNSLPNNVWWQGNSPNINKTGLDYEPHIFVILEDGEILIAPEEHHWCKHPSLAGGRPVWSAGEFGQEDGVLCVVDLASGHYVRKHALKLPPLATFTFEVIRAYAGAFAVNLHEHFRVHDTFS